MDLFKSYFTREALAGVLRNAQFIPGRLGEIFDAPQGATTTTVDVEELPLETITTSSAVPRGAPPSVLTLGNRKVHNFPTQTFAWGASVLADEVLNVRAAGSAAPEVIQARIADKTAKLKQQAVWQHEALRMNVLNTPTNSIGSAPASAAVAFGASDSAIRSAVHTNVILAMESALGGIPYTGIRAFCSEGFWAGLIESKTIRETYLNQIAADTLRGRTTDSFYYGGVNWERYRAGGTIAVATGKAKVIPEGVPGLLQQWFAPDDTLSSVGAGAMGAPWYLNSIPIEAEKGYRLTMQTHPVMVCTRPAAVLTIGLS